MVSHSNHSGRCCGIRVLFNFPHPNGTAVTERQLADAIRGADSRTGILKEVVLTDHQSRLHAPRLIKAGFKPVSRFVNANSGNTLTIYHLHENLLPLDDLPFSIEPAPDEPVTPPLNSEDTQTLYRVGVAVQVTNPRSVHYQYRARIVDLPNRLNPGTYLLNTGYRMSPASFRPI